MCSFRFEKCLLVTKVSRYEMMKYWCQKNGKMQGSISDAADLDNLLDNHETEKKFENRLVQSLKRLNVQCRLTNKFTYTSDQVNWADLVISVGGDGTFLMAASKIENDLKPVVGFNSNPIRSEGRLCLPRYFSENLDDTLFHIRDGRFRWLYRSRIKTKFEKNQSTESRPTFLHKSNDITDTDELSEPPPLALNEVFIGERLSAKVSFLELSLNDRKTKMKCSGLCVSTGTGSSSWHYSINRLTEQSVGDLLRLFSAQYGGVIPDDDMIRKVTDQYNRNLIFCPSSQQMSYSVRDLILADVWPRPKGLEPRGFCRHLKVRSKSLDACLVIDGGLLYDFKDGMTVELEVRPKEALKTIEIHM